MMIKYRNLYRFSKLGHLRNCFCLKFSLLKFGEPRQVNFFSEKLLKKIKHDIKEKNFKDGFMIVAPPATLPHDIDLVRDYIHKRLKIPTILLSKIKPVGDYSLLKSRSLRKKKVNSTMKVIKPKQLKGRKIILIDDVIASGSTIKETVRALVKAGADIKNIYIFDILKIDKKDFSIEAKLSEAAIIKSERRLINLLNKDEPVITSAVLKALVRMSSQAPERYEKIINKINKKTKNKIKKSFIKYTFLDKKILSGMQRIHRSL